MGHRGLCDSRLRRFARVPSASSQEVSCGLCVYRIASWRGCSADSFSWDGRLSRRGVDRLVESVGSRRVSDLVFETDRE